MRTNAKYSTHLARRLPMLTQMLRSACMVALLACSMATTALADTVDREVRFRFSGPVALPTVTLPSGEYIFRIANRTTGRDIIQVLNAESGEPYAMFFTVPVDRFEPPSEVTVSFRETERNVPPPITAWWHPEEADGLGVYYPSQDGAATTSMRAANVS